jgi:hypothetical protein
MKNRITNAQELRREIVRLEEISSRQKAELKKELYELKENFRPANILKGFVTDLTGIRFDQGNIFKDGISYTISVLLQQFLLKTEKKFEKGVYGIVDSVIDRVRDLIYSFSDSEAKKREREDN